jgi:hypothetical protein
VKIEDLFRMAFGISQGWGTFTNTSIRTCSRDSTYQSENMPIKVDPEMFPQLDDSRWNKYTGESKCGPRTIIVDTD